MNLSIKTMKRFKNQVAVISGGADGLGKGIATLIAAEGGTVALLDINIDLLQKTVQDFKAKGYSVSGFQTDVSSEGSVIAAIEQVETTFGKIDIMVNCAGIVGPTSTKITDYNVEDYDKIYSVNLRGSFLMTKYAIKAMEKHNYGRILLIASIAGKEGNPGMAGYSSTKAGVIGLVKAIGKEYATTGITVNGLAPAVIKTAFNDNTDAKQMEYMVAKIPMGRLGTIDEVAKISAWIVSKESTFTTGFIFDISGGRATY
jgi:2-dehydro-3-deoxy-L-rhamnonate dehydrogenase (NAD+)